MNGFAETVYMGCFRREPLSTIGGYAQFDGFAGEDAGIELAPAKPLVLTVPTIQIQTPR